MSRRRAHRLAGSLHPCQEFGPPRLERRLRTLGWLTCTALAACSASEPGAEPGALEAVRFTVDTVAGVEVARSEGTPPSWSLTPVTVVGRDVDLEGGGPPGGESPPDEFGRAVSATPGPDGNLWVGDGLAREIRIFDSNGTHVRTVGRQGEGPGEFASLYSLAWLGDRMLVLDFRAGRVAELDAGGRWLGARRVPGRVSGSPAQLRFYPTSDTVAFQWSLDVVDGEIRRLWVEHRPDGVGRTVPQVQPAPPDPLGVRCDTPDGAIHFFSLSSAPRLHLLPDPDGNTWVAWGGSYRLALLSPEGDTLRIIERVLEPLPFDDARWTRETAEYDTFRREHPDARCQPRRMPRPEQVAPLAGLIMDTRGRFWVRVRTADGTVWEVFDPDGRLAGRVPGFTVAPGTVPVVRGEDVVWIEADSLGVRRVRWSRLQSSTR